MNGIVEVKRCNKGDNVALWMLRLGVLLYILIWFEGCASMEAGVFVRRHDTSTETRTATETRWRCAFTDCSKEGN